MYKYTSSARTLCPVWHHIKQGAFRGVLSQLYQYDTSQMAAIAAAAKPVVRVGVGVMVRFIEHPGCVLMGTRITHAMIHLNL